MTGVVRARGLLSSTSAARPTRSGCGARCGTTARCTTSPRFPARATATTARAPRSSCSINAEDLPEGGRGSTPASTAASTRTSGRTGAAGATSRVANPTPRLCVRRRLRRVRPALQPVRQAARRRGDAHPGLQVARLGHHRLQRLGHVRPVRRRPDPLHRPRQRQRPAVPGLGGPEVAHLGLRPDLRVPQLGRGRTTTPGTTPRPTRPTSPSSSTRPAHSSTSAGLSTTSTTSRSTRADHDLGQRAQHSHRASATWSAGSKSGSTPAR